MRIFTISVLLFSTAILCSCTTTGGKEDTQEPPLTLTESRFSALPGWQDEDFKNVPTAFSNSCSAIQKKTSDYFKQGNEWRSLTRWQELCDQFLKIDQNKYKEFFEQNFTPYSVAAGDDTEGLFTGYYEASLTGSTHKHGKYQIPLRARPDDLVMVQLGDFRDDLKGRRIAGRVKDGYLKPYESREEIENGKLPDDQDKPLVWVDDPTDAFFVQIQGSGVVQLDDGRKMRIGYDGQNGHPYYAIGRELIERGALTKDNVSLQTIKAWLQANPDQANEVMNTNASYVFFKELENDGPVGGQGVPLTPIRSLAVDHTLIPYGVPVWLDIEYPEKGYKNIQRLVIAQDTGGAIRGPVRGDFFWGYGSFAEDKAGKMKSKGRYWVLLPKR